MPMSNLYCKVPLKRPLQNRKAAAAAKTTDSHPMTTPAIIAEGEREQRMLIVMHLSVAEGPVLHMTFVLGRR